MAAKTRTTRWIAELLIAAACGGLFPTLALGAENIDRLVLYAELARNAYRTHFNEPLPSQVRLVDRMTDRWTGFDASVYEVTRPGGKRETIISFAGTETARDWITNYGQAFDLDFGDVSGPFKSPPPLQHSQALKLVRKYQQQTARDPTRSLTVVGHSLGGGQAAYVGAHTGVDAYSFNGAALGGETLATVPADRRARGFDNIRQISITRDPVFNLTPRVPRAKQLGLAVALPPPPDQSGFLRPHDYISERPGIRRRVDDALQRHSIDTVVASLRYRQQSGSRLDFSPASDVLSAGRQHQAPAVWAPPDFAAASTWSSSP